MSPTPPATRWIVNPEASPSLVSLDTASDTVPAHGSVNHDYVVLADRFGAAVPWPSDQALADGGGFDAHFAHMRSFWNAQLDAIARISVPDPALVDAYESGFITTQIRGAATTSTRASTATRASSATTSSAS